MLHLVTADLFLAGDYSYVGSFENRVHIVDISQPQSMRQVVQVPTPGPAVDVKVSGHLAVVGVQSSGSDFGVVILDIADPPHPRILAEFSVPGWRGVHNLFLYQDRAYLAHAHAASPGITILDISDPTRPFVSGHWEHDRGFSNIVHDVFIRDHMAFVSDWSSGLVILDLTDADRPFILSSVPFEEGMHSAWMEQGYVYCNQEFGGWAQPLHIVDATDPRNPMKVGVFGAQPPPFAERLGPHNPFARNGFLYWAYYDAGLRIFDIAIPDKPAEIGYSRVYLPALRLSSGRCRRARPSPAHRVSAAPSGRKPDE